MLEEQLITAILQNPNSTVQVAVIIYILIRIEQLSKRVACLDGKLMTLLRYFIPERGDSNEQQNNN